MKVLVMGATGGSGRAAVERLLAESYEVTAFARRFAGPSAATRPRRRREERAVIESDLDWVVVQPVHLTDAADDSAPFDSVNGETRAMQVSRRSVGRYLAGAVARPELMHASVALSG